MEYSKEYLEYMKGITDLFAAKLTHNTATSIEEYMTPNYKREGENIVFDFQVDSECENIFYVFDEAPDRMDGVIERPADVVEAWMKIENEYALRWLKKNAITYDEWIAKYKNKNE